MLSISALIILATFSITSLMSSVSSGITWNILAAFDLNASSIEYLGADISRPNFSQLPLISAVSWKTHVLLLSCMSIEL